MIRKIILFFAFAVSVSVIAQKQQTSPYSFLGMGADFASKTIQESMMGGLGTAISNPVHINFSNPAALSNLRFTNYTLGAMNAQTRVKNQTDQQRASLFTISYLAIGIPLGDKAGISAGLRANTGVGYSLSEGDLLSEQGLRIYEGSGGSNGLFLASGVSLFKGLSIGLEGAFIFGNIESTETSYQQDTGVDIREKQTAVLRGFDTKLGIYYLNKVSKKNSLSFGLTLLKSKDITVDETTSFYNGLFASNYEDIESSSPVENTSGSIVTPIKTGFALGYGLPSKWHLGLEYSFREALSYSEGIFQNKIQKVTFSNYEQISFGGYYTPNLNSLTNYFSRVTYRAGIKYENLGMQIGGVQLEDYGISFGVGLPIGKGLSNLNIGLEYGIKGKESPQLIEERYFNIKFGLSFGDKWFRQRKID